jgi:arsenate reductase
MLRAGWFAGLSLVLSSLALAAEGERKIVFYPQLETYISARAAEFDRISAERRQALDRLAQFVRDRRSTGEPVRLNFICTHNSRRSHLGQIWASVAAERYGVHGVETYSGGTEATAFNPRAVAALERAGFHITAEAEVGNPRYQVRISDKAAAMVCFSKKYSDPVNPSQDFAAVMTCTEADKGCPLIPGALARVALPYRDPKEADGTPEETARYDERCADIAREMLYVFAQAAK